MFKPQVIYEHVEYIKLPNIIRGADAIHPHPSPGGKITEFHLAERTGLAPFRHYNTCLILRLNETNETV